MKPSISVIIPTFNRADLVINALESVLAQTYQAYEIIVVDDGSTDNTACRLVPYRDRIRYLYQRNRGVSAARNNGINAATGEWIATLDSDDVWLPSKLERQMEAVKAAGGAYGACFTDCRWVGDPNSQPTVFERAGFEGGQSFGTLDGPIKYALARYPIVWVQSLLVRKPLIGAAGGFDEAMAVAEDTDFVFRLALKTDFCFVPEALVHIDRRPARQPGLTKLFHLRDDRVYSSRERMYRKWLANGEVSDPAVRRRIQESLRNLYFDWMLEMLCHLRIFEAFEKAKQVRLTGDDRLSISSKLAIRAGAKLSRALGRHDRPA
jgi:glycosyltransferase involved in cell wall biosynthesis